MPAKFRFPSGDVEISDEAGRRIIGVLAEIGEHTGGYDFDSVRRAIERGLKPSAAPITLYPGEDDALMRALDWAWPMPWFRDKLVQLRDSLLASTGPRLYTADVVREGRPTITLFSCAGAYRVGNHLPPEREGDEWVRWRVARIEHDATSDRERLICEPVDLALEAPSTPLEPDRPHGPRRGP